MKFGILYKQVNLFEVQYKRRKKLRQESIITEVVYR